MFPKEGGTLPPKQRLSRSESLCVSRLSLASWAHSDPSFLVGAQVHDPPTWVNPHPLALWSFPEPLYLLCVTHFWVFEKDVSPTPSRLTVSHGYSLPPQFCIFQYVVEVGILQPAAFPLSSMYASKFLPCFLVSGENFFLVLNSISLSDCASVFKIFIYFYPFTWKHRGFFQLLVMMRKSCYKNLGFSGDWSFQLFWLNI